jgi:hypothetical protein
MLMALVLSTLAATTTPWAAGTSAGEDLEISIVTFGEGDEIAEWFGHAAIIVDDTVRNQRRLYNYGEYAFDRTLIWKYLKGHLTFQVGERDVERTLKLYAAKNRDIRMQVLNLSPAQRLAVAVALATNVRPENRMYLYDHYSDNCTTRIRDLLDNATAGQLMGADGPGRMTLREHTRSLTVASMPIAIVIDGLLNDEVDRPLLRSQEAFLPREFETWLDDVTIVDDAGNAVPLVLRKEVYFKAERPPLPKPPSSLMLAFLGVAAAVVAAVVMRGGRAVFVVGTVGVVVGAVVGVPGTVLTLMATATDHHVTFGNLHLLWANPLTLLLVPLGALSARTRAGAGVVTAFAVVAVTVAVGAVVAVVADVSDVAGQDASWPLAVCGPLLLVFSICAVRRRRQMGGAQLKA